MPCPPVAARRQYRPFCAIGSGGDEFVKSIVEKAEAALGHSIPEVRRRRASGPSTDGTRARVRLC